MHMRLVTVALSLLFVLVPVVVTGQTPPAAPLGRLSVQAMAGRTVTGDASVFSAAFGYAPASRLEILLNVERIHAPVRTQRFGDVSSVTRGGTMTFVSGELRLSLLPADRVSPYATAGAGGGVARPNVNDHFPDRVRNDLLVGYVGVGVRVPLRGGFSLLGEAWAMLALEANDAVAAVWPVRAGVAWRF